jgi:hypothetical protein
MHLRRIAAPALVLFLISPSCPATDAQGRAAEPASLASLQAAVDYRAALAAALAAGERKPVDALNELRGRSDLMGLGLPEAQDRSAALLDVGHRLLASGHPEAAEPFFIAAENALGEAIAQLSVDEAAVKAQLLAQRAFVRDNYLNMPGEAAADLEAAVKLQPDDQRLRRKRDTLPPAKTGRDAEDQTQKGGN